MVTHQVPLHMKYTEEFLQSKQNHLEKKWQTLLIILFWEV